MHILLTTFAIQFCMSSCQEALHQDGIVQAIKDRDFHRFSAACVQLKNVDFVAGCKFDDDFYRGAYGSRGSMDREKWTPLMVLCGGERICEFDELCRERMVSLLLGLGADAKYTDGAGQSCLGQSILRRRPVIARMLLRAGAHPRETGPQMDHTMMSAVQCQPDLIADLVCHGADVNLVQDGKSYGDLAVRTRSYKGLRALVAAGFDLSLLDERYQIGISSPLRAPKDSSELAEYRRTVTWLRRKLSKENEDRE